jgi:hypothetical protein
MFLDFKSFKPLRNLFASFTRKAEPPRVIPLDKWAEGERYPEAKQAPNQTPSQYPTWESNNAEAESSRATAQTPAQQQNAPVTQDPNVSPVQQKSSPKQEDPNYAYVYDPEHKMSSAELSELHPGKHFSQTEGGWTTLDPQQQREEALKKQEKAIGVKPEEPAKEKKHKEEKIDVTTATPEQIEQAQKKLYEFHRPPTEEEKQQIKDYTDNQINQYIDNVISGNANEASLPEMTDDEKVSFFIGLFAAERAKLVSQIKIQGRNRRRVQMAKELQAKIVGDLNQYANDNINYAIKTISERKEKPKTFGGSLNEFTSNNGVSEDGNTSEDYINDFVSRGGEGWDYGQRSTMRGYDPKEITSAERESAGKIRNSLLKGIIESSEKLENTNLHEDFKTVKSGEEGGLKTISNSTITIGSTPPSTNSLSSLHVTFPLSSNTQQTEEAFAKIIKSLDKKNLGCIVDINSPNGILTNKDNVTIKARNWKELEEINKIVDKEMSKVNGVKTSIDDNRFGLTENDIVNTLADMKRKMKFSGDGSFTVDSEFDNQKLAKYALAAKSIGCTISDIGGKYVLKAIDGNSNAYNSGVSPEDSDEDALNKIKMADEKDKQEPAPLPDPNEDVRGLLGEQEKKNRELRMRNRKPQKPAPAPKPVPAPKPTPSPKPAPTSKQPKPQAVAPTTQNPPELPLNSTSHTEVIPTPVGTVSYKPQVKDADDLEREFDEITDWQSADSFGKLERMIQDYNVSVASASSNYDTFAMSTLKKLGEKLDDAVKTKIDTNASQPPFVDTQTANKYFEQPDFVDKQSLLRKGVNGVFKVDQITDDKLPLIDNLISFRSRGKDKVSKKFDVVSDGIWIKGKHGDFFSGWFEVEGLNPEEIVFVSEDKKLMINVNKKDYETAEAFINRNPYMGGIKWKPTVSNMEGFYKGDELLKHNVPVSYTPDTNTKEIKSMLASYPSLSTSDPDGRKIMSGMLGLKHKLINMMDTPQRRTMIKSGFREAVKELMKGESIPKIKSALLESINPKTGQLNLSDDQKNMISSLPNDDFMKILSGVNVVRGNEENAVAKEDKEPTKMQKLTQANFEKYQKTGKPTDLLELVITHPSGLFRPPEKGDRFYREIMVDLDPRIRKKLINPRAKQTLDEVAKEAGLGNNQFGRDSREEYLGTSGTENFFNGLVSQIGDFYSENKDLDQAEADYYMAQRKKMKQDAEKLMSSPKKVRKADIREGDIYKIGGEVYKVIDNSGNPESSNLVLKGPKGEKTLSEIFGGNEDINVDGHLPKTSPSWEVVNEHFQDEDQTPQTSNTEDLLTSFPKDKSFEDIQDELSYNPSSGIASEGVEPTTPEDEESYRNWQEGQNTSDDDYNPLLEDEESWGSKRSSITNRRKRMAKKGRF